jgi:uncharacterized protein DUF2784
MRVRFSRFAADSVLLGHFAFILFGVFGGFLCLRSFAWAWIHLPVVIWSAVVNLASWTCPLTPVEKEFRARSGNAYSGGFVQHYIGSAVYPKGMPRQMELIAGISILSWNVIVYAIVLWLRLS